MGFICFWSNSVVWRPTRRRSRMVQDLSGRNDIVTFQERVWSWIRAVFFAWGFAVEMSLQSFTDRVGVRQYAWVVSKMLDSWRLSWDFWELMIYEVKEGCESMDTPGNFKNHSLNVHELQRYSWLDQMSIFEVHQEFHPRPAETKRSVGEKKYVCICIIYIYIPIPVYVYLQIWYIVYMTICIYMHRFIDAYVLTCIYALIYTCTVCIHIWWWCLVRSHLAWSCWYHYTMQENPVNQQAVDFFQ